MSDENNMFGNDNQQGGFGGQSEVNRQDNYNQEPVDSAAQEYSQQGSYGQPTDNGVQSYGGQQSYSGQQGYNGQQNGNASYGGQNQQTPLSGYAEPVYHQQYNNYSQEESQGFGIASMICGILALVTCCCWCPCAPLAVVSIVLGIIQISKGTAKGMSIAGIVCSAIGLVMMIVFIVAGIFMNSSGEYQNFLHEYNDILEDLQEDSYTNYQHHL